MIIGVEVPLVSFTLLYQTSVVAHSDSAIRSLSRAHKQLVQAAALSGREPTRVETAGPNNTALTYQTQQYQAMRGSSMNENT